MKYGIVVSKIVRYFPRFIGILLIVYLIRFVNITKVFSLIINFKVKWLIIAIIINFIAILIRAYRWQKILEIQQINIGLIRLFNIYLVSFAFGLISPGRIGDFSKALYLKQEGYSLSKSILSSFIDRVYDMIFLIIFGIICLFMAISLFQNQLIILLVFLLVITIFIYMICKNWMFLKNVIRRFLNEKLGEILKNIIIKIRYESSLFGKKSIIICFFLTVIAWFSYYIQSYFLSKVININIPFIYLVVGISISTVLNLLPISMLGIGTRDAVFITVFSTVAISKEQSLAFSALFLLMFILNILTGVIIWWFKPINIPSLLKNLNYSVAELTK
ncbi:MAG: lysylphosphatidylglycerol synthase transmembrane domain-containing protein [Elusimicrobia bacterium]|nr:lysylphosphatidylglycerol synthase transmembrane domain-containing protein [Elusimicrobiota bacterium]